MTATPVHFSERSGRTTDQPISYFMQQAVENPKLISLAAGLVDPESLPGEAIEEAFDYLLSRPQKARAALQYGTTQGYAPLRDKLLGRLARTEGVTAAELSLNADDIVVT